MGTDLWGILFSILLLLMFAQEMEGRSISYDYQHLHMQHPAGTAIDAHHTSSDTESMNPSVNIFFRINDLKGGKTMPVSFSRKYNASTTPPLLSREEAESIPFSSKQLPYLLDLFSFPKDSPQAKAMEYTLAQCEHSPRKSVTKSCSSSVESMLDFAQATFGSHARLNVLATSFDKKFTVPLQNFTIIKEPKVIDAPKIIGCHKMPYPYAVFYCHTQASKSRLFEVSLEGENRDRIKSPVMCHMDTSQWDPDHIAFRLLKAQPGACPVCHFFPTDDLVWYQLP